MDRSHTDHMARVDFQSINKSIRDDQNWFSKLICRHHNEISFSVHMFDTRCELYNKKIQTFISAMNGAYDYIVFVICQYYHNWPSITLTSGHFTNIWRHSLTYD